ncbi:MULTISPECIES: type I-E CRISPR-associated protein Cse1/CasA [Actinoalloteichus]|uniref:type I-E CRISPR-associated protein Cse1/CasA n=1 Tax=Actinoalloteichus TaxID=65496 RepID=UPI0004226550|nr:type I-E CRISPR-associated protein Cse1/CasA [Actinoalloteichus caeruleus]
MTTFDLIDEPWLPLVCGSAVGEVSLADALLDAHEFGDLAGGQPTMAPTLLRQVLLPVVLDALGPMTRDVWLRTFRARRFDAGQRDRIGGYLAEWRHRFDLFHPTAPFAQAAGLRTPSSRTRHVLATSPRRRDGTGPPAPSPAPGLRPAEAAWWLLHVHCWDSAGIKTGALGDPHLVAGKTTGNPAGSLGGLGPVLPLGTTLFDTLLFNLPIGPATPGDSPQWRRPPTGARWVSRPAVGPLDLLTWLSRRVLLLPVGGQGQPVRVRHAVVTAGDRLSGGVGEFEPHSVWTGGRVAEGDEPSWRPRRHVPGRLGWRGLSSMLALNPTSGGEPSCPPRVLDVLGGLVGDEGVPDDYPLRLAGSGVVYGSKSGTVDDVLADTVSVPVRVLRSEEARLRAAVAEVCQQAEELARAANRLSERLLSGTGTDSPTWNGGEAVGDSVLAALDTQVRRFLVKLSADAAVAGQGDVERLRTAWEAAAVGALTRVVGPLLATPAGTARTTGRQRVSAQLALGTFRRRVREILPRARWSPEGLASGQAEG